MGHWRSSQNLLHHSETIKQPPESLYSPSWVTGDHPRNSCITHSQRSCIGQPPESLYNPSWVTGDHSRTSCITQRPLSSLLRACITPPGSLETIPETLASHTHRDHALGSLLRACITPLGSLETVPEPLASLRDQ